MNIVQRPTRRTLPERVGAVKAIVLHTTGDTDLDKVIAFYTASDGLQPHYMVGLDGTVYQIAQEDHVAWHCLIEPSEAALYRNGYREWCRYHWTNNEPVDTGQELTNYKTWRDTWQPKNIQSPLDLVTGAHPNLVSVGIELLQPVSPTNDIFTDAQYTSTACLVSEIAARHSISIDREHVIGHYDASPMRRSNPSGSWDPGERFSFDRLWQSFECGFQNKLK